MAEISSIPCARCGGEVIEFTVPNELWNEIVRWPDGKERADEYICLDCWHKAVEKRIQFLNIQIANLTMTDYEFMTALKDVTDNIISS